jgi:D-glycero-D-manno-heptose 1,7-bisphosphate phosphatase
MSGIGEPGGRPAVFLDRDGTLVHARYYPSRPEELQLYDGIAPGLRSLQQLGFALVVVTNQSGLARGLFSEADLTAMHHHLRYRLVELGVTLDGIYHCPHLPHGTVPHLSIPCSCRKPAPGLLHRAATDLQLNLTKSWMIGDILDDVEAGKRAGSRTVLVDLGTESFPELPVRAPHFVARDTSHALEIVLCQEATANDCEYEYWPPSWEAAKEFPTWMARPGRAETGAFVGATQ